MWLINKNSIRMFTASNVRDVFRSKTGLKHVTVSDGAGVSIVSFLSANFSLSVEAANKAVLVHSGRT